ncbi:MAG: hypothetical protein H6622_02975 [Halobacteriovoraceae bacterium]|nr:hypothetical protein [Halobacteriovoraceae bacterium]
MNKYLLFFLINFVLIFHTALGDSAQVKENCLVKRAAFDIGSGSTKVKVALVDVCKSLIKKNLFEKSIKIDFNEELERSSFSFSENFVDNAISRIHNLLRQAKSFDPTSIVGVATSAIRNSNNGRDFVIKLKTKTGLNTKIITQEEEAKIGFYGALASTKYSKDSILVWDIGGGSMQFMAINDQGRERIQKGKLASVTFKNNIINDIQKSKKLSPNPISKDDFKRSFEFAKNLAAESVDKDFFELIPKKKILGIGSVHYYSVSKQVGKKTYSKLNIDKKIKKLLNKTDKQIGGSYADTQVSNLILVSAFMEQLGIGKVHALRVNNTDGVLINNQYW